MFGFLFRNARQIRRLPGAKTVSSFLLNRFAEGSVVPIRYGPAAGLIWDRSHSQPNPYWLGSYEPENQDALKRHLKPGQTFWDLGAHAGFFTLVAAGLVGPEGRCVAVEPDPVNVASVEKKLKLNGLTRCKVFKQAVADKAGKASFYFAKPGTTLGHLGKAGEGEKASQVEVTTLDRLMARCGRPDFIKMDVEGAEVRALKGAARLLKTARPGFLLELHGPDCKAGVKPVFLKAGYTLFDIHGRPADLNRELPFQILALPKAGN